MYSSFTLLSELSFGSFGLPVSFCVSLSTRIVTRSKSILVLSHCRCCAGIKYRPLWHSIFVSHGILGKRKDFFVSEIAFSWAAAEVLVLAVTIFSILQIPKFGNGLIQSGCKECNRVDSALYGEFAIICVSSVLTVCVNFYLFRRAHKVVWQIRDE
jgi:uncharacterized membrane protein YGL010W